MTWNRTVTRSNGSKYERNFELSQKQIDALHELEKHPRPVALAFETPTPHQIGAATARSLLKHGFAKQSALSYVAITPAGSEALARSRGWVPK